MTSSKTKIDWAVLSAGSNSEDESEQRPTQHPKRPPQNQPQSRPQARSEPQTQAPSPTDLFAAIKNIDSKEIHLFIGGVHYNATQNDISEYYKKNGVVLQQIRGLGKGAFIIVVNKDDAFIVARISLNVLFGRQFNVKLSNRPLQSRPANPNERSRKYQPKNEQRDNKPQPQNNVTSTNSDQKRQTGQHVPANTVKNEDKPSDVAESELVRSLKAVKLSQEHEKIISSLKARVSKR